VMALNQGKALDNLYQHEFFLLYQKQMQNK